MIELQPSLRLNFIRLLSPTNRLSISPAPPPNQRTSPLSVVPLVVLSASFASSPSVSPRVSSAADNEPQSVIDNGALVQATLHLMPSRTIAAEAVTHCPTRARRCKDPVVSCRDISPGRYLLLHLPMQQLNHDRFLRRRRHHFRMMTYRHIWMEMSHTRTYLRLLLWRLLHQSLLCWRYVSSIVLDL